MATNIQLYHRIREAMSDDAEVVALMDKLIAPYEARKSKSAERAADVKAAIQRLSSRGVGRFSARMVKDECGLVCNGGRGYTIQAASRALNDLVNEGYVVRSDKQAKGEPNMYEVV